MLVTYGSFSSPFFLSEGRVIEIAESRLRELVLDLLRSVSVDEAWYLDYYRDVQEAVSSGEALSGKDHYITAGYFENRMPRWISVDEQWYLQTYADVKEAVRRGEVSSSQTHFMADGFREGRLPFASWSLVGS